MSANSKGWVQVLITSTQWLEVSGVTTQDLREAAINENGVIEILKVQWEEPDDLLA